MGSKPNKKNSYMHVHITCTQMITTTTTTINGNIIPELHSVRLCITHFILKTIELEEHLII